MKKLLYPVLLGLAVFSLAGCTESKETEVTIEKTEAEVMKCDAGKCGVAMEKTEEPAQKPSAEDN